MVDEKEVDSTKKISTLLEDLLLLERYIKDLFTFFPLPVCFVSPLGVIFEVNPAFEKAIGYTSYEIVGKSIENFFEKEKIESLTKEILKDGSVEAREVSFLAKEGKKIDVSIFGQIRRNEQEEVTGFFIGFFDLTKIKKTENDLQGTQVALLNMLEDIEDSRKKAEEEKNKTEAIISNFADGLLVFNENNRISLINPQAEKFFNISNKEMVGKSILELSVFPELETIVNLVGPKIEGISRKELSIRDNLVLEISTISILKEEKKIGSLITIHDITREKMIEKMKTEFVSLAAHQLRTPLSAIKWTLRMLLDGDLGTITSEQRDFIEKTYVSNERMINLINDLLNVTRIEEGRYLYKPVSSDIGPIVQFVINSYKDEYARKKIKLEFKPPEKNLPKVSVDVEKIKLVIQNFLDNALKYTPVGGEVFIFLKNIKKEIQLGVKDTGVGVPKNQQERMFNKFFRAANVLGIDTEGSGLGLFISKNIIEAHGGKIWFESEENKGATFYFSLPVKEEFTEFLEEF
jgi:PAS domain S-box-containing protein